MTTTSRPITVRIDAALDQVQRHRERLLAEAAGARRSAGIAELYEREARLWSALFDHSRIRVHWRAALVAEAYARQRARYWWYRAAADVPNTLAPAVADEWAGRLHADTSGGAA